MKKILFAIFFSIAAVFVFGSCSSVEQEIPVLEKIVLDVDELTLQVGEEHTFKVTLMPKGVQADKLVWTSDNPMAVTVENGIVTALQAGDAVVKVACGEISASCKVTVNEPQITLLTLDPKSVEMYVGGTAYLTATVVPDNTGLELQWSSSDNGIVTVDNTGKLTAIAAGEAVVTVTCGDKSAECKVTVIEESAAPAVGYYYYSDGTWSATLSQEKQVVGVVFYVGNPAKDDAVLAKEHAGCVHGLVVSINEMSGFAWRDMLHITIRWQPGWRRI